MASASTGSRPSYRLLTVNNAPARAKVLIGRVVKALEDRFTIEHVGNCESPDDLERMVQEMQPDIVCCASMWTPEQSLDMQQRARSVKPDIKTYAIPQGLQVNEGPDAVVSHLTEHFPALLE